LPLTTVLAHRERTAPKQDQVELPHDAQTFIDLGDKPRHEIAGAFSRREIFLSPN
jgi:hypothetical protein